MTGDSIDASQRDAARIAGAAYVASFVIVIYVNFGILQRLIVGDNPALTAGNILAHETFFRAGIAGQLLYCVGVLVTTAALYIVLKPVGPLLALLSAIGRLVHGLTWLLVTLNLFTALRLLTGPNYARMLPPDQLPVLARLYLSGSDQYYAGLLFWSLASTLAACLWLKSRYVPRSLAAFGVLASAWCVACTLVLFLFPDFPNTVNLWWFDTPMALFELALSFLLVFRGLRPRSGDGVRGLSGRSSCPSIQTPPMIIS